MVGLDPLIATVLVYSLQSLKYHTSRFLALGLQQAVQLTLLLFPDFAAVEALVDATHRYKEIFYESADQ